VKLMAKIERAAVELEDLLNRYCRSHGKYLLLAEPRSGDLQFICTLGPHREIIQCPICCKTFKCVWEAHKTGSRRRGDEDIKYWPPYWSDYAHYKDYPAAELYIFCSNECLRISDRLQERIEEGKEKQWEKLKEAKRLLKEARKLTRPTREVSLLPPKESQPATISPN